MKEKNSFCEPQVENTQSDSLAKDSCCHCGPNCKCEGECTCGPDCRCGMED